MMLTIEMEKARIRRTADSAELYAVLVPLLESAREWQRQYDPDFTDTITAERIVHAQLVVDRVNVA